MTISVSSRAWLAMAGSGVARIITLAALVVLSVFVSSAAHGDPPAGFAKGRVLVKFYSGTTIAKSTSAMRAIHATASRRLGRLPVEMLLLPKGASERSAVNRLRELPQVEYAELDARVKIAADPNDPSYPSQWHLPNISAPQAWAVTVGNPNLIVAVLDTGCDPSHPDLTANYVPGWNFYDGNSNSTDVHGHGTMVAGCVGARGNNATGVASVSFVGKIMPCRVTDATGYALYSTIASAIQWAADQGARIANISIEGTAGSSTVQTAAQYMWNKGGLTVCAAGNDGADPGYAPGPYTINVSATNSANTKSSWSSYGSYITVSAPGEGILTTTMGGGYGGGSGTSYSAPVTCGALALTWAANPYLTNSQLVGILKSTATDLGTAGFDTYYGYGKVNVGAAVQAALSTAVDTTAPTASITSPSGGASVADTVSVSVTATDSMGVTNVQLFVDGSLYASDSSSPYSFSWNTGSFSNGTHTLMAKAFDAAGNIGASASVSVTVNNVAPPADTTAPTVTITSPANGTKVGNTLSVSVAATDNVGVVTVVLYADGKQVGTSTSAGPTFKVNTRKWGAGTHTLQAVASDAAGNTGSSAVVSVTK